MTTRYERRGDVAVLQIDNPPVNGLGLSTRRREEADSGAAGHQPGQAAPEINKTGLIIHLVVPRRVRSVLIFIV